MRYHEGEESEDHPAEDTSHWSPATGQSIKQAAATLYDAAKSAFSHGTVANVISAAWGTTASFRNAIANAFAGDDDADGAWSHAMAVTNMQWVSHAALDLLASLGGDGRKVVVTPGMVELGSLQREENRVFARRASKEADELVVVGRTNRPALLEGSANGRATVTVVASRDEAVAWVRASLHAGDVVLYENDLPDHYP